MRIGLIADTHEHLPPDIVNIFQGTKLILHAGDIGSQTILDKLETISTTKAVYGNVDIYSLASRLTATLFLIIEDMKLLMLHNIGNIKSFLWRIKRGDYNPTPDIIIYGHTHIPVFQKVDGIYFINPGSAGKPKRGQNATVMILEIKKAKTLDCKLIKLS